ncbi:plasmid mobilization relaxosome protein MobC [Herbiconiux sp. A18JL235]|uniref:Plasmid mobilization relaxosome protein MobC n=1 Tax=Herbiconiux sp. A18JL235 TaxID=3152363 RepID=A0AB39BLW0_9MICO
MKTVAVRLTPDEHARWVHAAEEDGRQQLGRWVRESVDDRLAGRPDRPAPAASEEVRAMRAELSHVGSNLNQIAKALNVAELGGGAAPELRVVAQVIEDTRKTMASLRDVLQELG